MKPYSILLAVLLIFGSWAASQQTQIVESTYATKAAQISFAGIDGLMVRESSVYLVDRVMNRVAVLDMKGLTYRSDFSHSDVADASLRTPGFIAVTSRYIFVADYGMKTIRIYTTRFEFVNKIRVTGDIFGMAADADESIWIASATMESQQSLKKIDISGNVLQEMSLKNAKGNPFEILYTFCIDENNYFYVAYFTKNCIEVLHPSRGFIRQFMVPGLPSIVPWKTIRGRLFSKNLNYPDGVIFSSITSDHNGRLYILTGDYSETPCREVDICSVDGTFLSWCNLNESSHLIQADRKNHLITVEGKKNKVKIYDIKHYQK